MAKIIYKDTDKYPADAECLMGAGDVIGEENDVIGDENDSALVFLKQILGDPLQQIRAAIKKFARIIRRQSL